MKKYVTLFAGLAIGWSTASGAFAQASASGSPSSGGSAATFNPFATFSLNRFTFNTLGFLQVGASNPSASSGGLSEASGDDIPLAVVVRPPYRPPVRSPFRPPPRPPF